MRFLQARPSRSASNKTIGVRKKVTKHTIGIGFFGSETFDL